MTDRELLELAAKAAKNGAFWHPNNPFSRAMELPCETAWNPLDDDGDALRLAVTLYMGVQINGTTHRSLSNRTVVRFSKNTQLSIMHRGDPNDTTRRAIVRAAAEIGKRLDGDRG